jgi:hypothetical protein
MQEMGEQAVGDCFEYLNCPLFYWLMKMTWRIQLDFVSLIPSIMTKVRETSASMQTLHVMQGTDGLLSQEKIQTDSTSFIDKRRALINGLNN